MASGDGRVRGFDPAWPDLPESAKRVGPAALVLLLALVVWQWAVTRAGIPPVILPTPVRVAAAGAALGTTLLADAAVTVATALLGLAGGVCVGLSLAFAMTYSRTAAAVVRPYVVALRIAPLIAVAPLVFLWLGDGIVARSLLVATMTLFPVTIASYDALRSVPREYLDVADSVGAPHHRTFIRVRVPAAASGVFAGVKLAAVLGVVGSVVAEFVTLRAGLGYRVFYTSTYLLTARTFAALAVLSLVGVAFYLGPALIQRRVRWGTGRNR